MIVILITAALSFAAGLILGMFIPIEDKLEPDDTFAKEYGGWTAAAASKAPSEDELAWERDRQARPSAWRSSAAASSSRA
jgi:hypothetical protein